MRGRSLVPLPLPPPSLSRSLSFLPSQCRPPRRPRPPCTLQLEAKFDQSVQGAAAAILTVRPPARLLFVIHSAKKVKSLSSHVLGYQLAARQALFTAVARFSASLRTDPSWRPQSWCCRSLLPSPWGQFRSISFSPPASADVGAAVCWLPLPLANAAFPNSAAQCANGISDSIENR